MTDRAALELVSITTGYGSTTVVRDVSLVVGAGEVVALLGPNGAGKTTLLKAAAGLLPSTSGSVRVSGQDVSRLRASKRSKAGVCLIPEGRGVFPSLTVRDNLRLANSRRTQGTDPTKTALEVFPEISGRLDSRAGALSGGQQQMVALARAWIASPSIILLDEVSMGLAPRIVDEIFEALGRLSSAGASILLVEQYVDRALDIADRVALLNRGSIAFTGSASDVDRDSLINNYLGSQIAS